MNGLTYACSSCCWSKNFVKLHNLNIFSQLVSKRRRRSGSRSTRTSRRSSRSRTGFKSPTSNRSSTHHSRSRRARISTTCSEDDEKDDVLEELQSNSQKCLLDVLKIRLSSMDLRTADRLSAFSENITSEDILVGGFIGTKKHTL